MRNAPTADSQPLFDLFSTTEREVLRLVATGYSNHEIAEQLILATSIIKWTLSETYSKFSVNNYLWAIILL